MADVLDLKGYGCITFVTIVGKVSRDHVEGSVSTGEGNGKGGDFEPPIGYRSSNET